jgi:hypothetical protein
MPTKVHFVHPQYPPAPTWPFILQPPGWENSLFWRTLGTSFHVWNEWSDERFYLGFCAWIIEGCKNALHKHAQRRPSRSIHDTNAFVPRQSKLVNHHVTVRRPWLWLDKQLLPILVIARVLFTWINCTTASWRSVTICSSIMLEFFDRSTPGRLSIRRTLKSKERALQIQM